MPTDVSEVRSFVRDFSGYQFQTDDLLRCALNAERNKQLAFVGAWVLPMALVDAWGSTGTPKELGHNIVTTVANTSSLEDFARTQGIGKFVTVNPGQRGQPVMPRVLQDTVRALVGAIWHDCGKELDVVKHALATMGLWHSALS